MSAAVLLSCTAVAAAPSATPSRWEVIVAIRISGGTGAPMAVQLALPFATASARANE